MSPRPFPKRSLILFLLLTVSAGLLLLIFAQTASRQEQGLPPTVSPTLAAPPTSVARAVLFSDSLCTFCRDIVEHQLPPAIERFGEQVQILVVDVNTETGRQLYQAALQAYGVPRGVPVIFIGEDSAGGVNIPTQFPLLVDAYLAEGGVDWPAIPGLEAYLTATAADESSSPATTAAASPPPPAVDDEGRVRALLFWQDGCPSCHDVLANVLPPLQQKYGAQLEIVLVEVRDMEDVERLYAIAAQYGLTRSQTGVPFLVIGEHALVGTAAIRTELPALIEDYRMLGGVALPTLPGLDEMMAAAPVTTLAEALESGIIAESTPWPRGFGLATGVMVIIGLSLAYSLAALARPRLPVPAGGWLDAASLVLTAAGMGVAAYLSYVEVRAASAFCGPIGECNLVQSSPYARLFGVLPVGILGLIGNLLLLAALGARRFLPRLRLLGAGGFFGMAFFGTAFSFYLTALERFVIRAVCLWCLTSAVLMTLLLWTSLAPLRQAIPRRHDNAPPSQPKDKNEVI